MAVPIAEAVQDQLDRALAAAVGTGAVLPGRPVLSRNRHITLRFVGQCSRTRVGALSESIAAVDLGGQFDASLGRLGAFPRVTKARVLWVGLDAGTSGFLRLAGAVEAAARSVGLEPDERPFRAHVTLSRLPDPDDISRLVEGAHSLAIPFLVDRVVLYESHLTNGPPTYEPLTTFELGPSDGAAQSTDYTPGGLAGAPPGTHITAGPRAERAQ